MKILLVHNFYGSDAPSGESNVFNIEKALLEGQGHIVNIFSRDSDEIRNQGVLGLIKGALSTPWNPFSAAALRTKVIEFEPDVVHVHNTFPLISPAIFHSISDLTATVITLHNYRLLCPAAIPIRNGKVCTECISSKSAYPAIKYGCYRNSRLATIPLAANVSLHRAKKTWCNHVDAFIALSDFQKNLMAEGGLPSSKIYVKPNFYEGDPCVVPYMDRPRYIVFVGRLSSEKGIRNLIEAWREWGADAPELRIIGSGPLREELEKLSDGLAVNFYGHISSEAAQAQIANAALLVLPSECFEGFPMVVREAFALGTPVATSNLGPLPSIVKHDYNGVIFEPFNPSSIRDMISAAWRDSNKLLDLAKGARESYESLYNQDVNYKALINIYQIAIDRKERRL